MHIFMKIILGFVVVSIIGYGLMHYYNLLDYQKNCVVTIQSAAYPS